MRRGEHAQTRSLIAGAPSKCRFPVEQEGHNRDHQEKKQGDDHILVFARPAWPVNQTLLNIPAKCARNLGQGKPARGLDRAACLCPFHTVSTVAELSAQAEGRVVLHSAALLIGAVLACSQDVTNAVAERVVELDTTFVIG